MKFHCTSLPNGYRALLIVMTTKITYNICSVIINIVTDYNAGGITFPAANPMTIFPATEHTTTVGNIYICRRCYYYTGNTIYIYIFSSAGNNINYIQVNTSFSSWMAAGYVSNTIPIRINISDFCTISIIIGSI